MDVNYISFLESIQSSLGLFLTELLFILPSILLYSLVALLLSIIALIIIGKRKLFYRTQKTWNIAAKLHYPVWVVIFIIAGGSYGFIHGIELRAEKVLEDNGKPFIEANTTMLYERLLENLPVTSNGEEITIRKATQHLINNLHYEMKSDSGIEKAKKQSLKWIKSTFGEWIISKTVNLLVTKSVKKSGEALHFSNDDLTFNKQALIDMDFSKAENTISPLIYKALKNQIKHTFLGFKLNLFMFFGLAITLLLIEPACYFLWKRQQEKKILNQSTT